MLLHSEFQSKERTLRDDEVAQWSSQIIGKLERWAEYCGRSKRAHHRDHGAHGDHQGRKNLGDDRHHRNWYRDIATSYDAIAELYAVGYTDELSRKAV